MCAWVRADALAFTGLNLKNSVPAALCTVTRELYDESFSLSTFDSSLLDDVAPPETCVLLLASRFLCHAVTTLVSSAFTVCAAPLCTPSFVIVL